MLFVIIVSSCKNTSNDVEIGSPAHEIPFLFRMNVMFTDAETNVSFPVWFNDSIIISRNISKITRDFYLLDEDEESDRQDLKRQVPREKREYWFGSDGQMKEMKISYYYDNREIGITNFIYQGAKDQYGFVNVSRVSDQKFQYELSDDNLNYYFNIYGKIKTTDKYLAYENSNTGDYLFFMLKRKYWGPLSVDSILNPTPKDIITLGTAYYPTKKYRVKNKVNEMDVQQYIYSKPRKKKNKTIKMIIRQDYPFDQKRTILYDKKGFCNGYIDSTFSGDKYLTRIVTDIKTNKNNLPTRVIHKNENQLNKNAKVSIELFTYE